jgi:phosphoserine aminotransferase
MLPLPALDGIVENFMNFGGKSILEISHRSSEFDGIIEGVREKFSNLLAIPNDYEVLFLQGGASMQFAMVPINLMEKSADYVVTGHWAEKALAEAVVIGDPKIVFSSKDEGFRRVPRPEEIKVSKDASYVHITTNNTIFGTQYRDYPDTGNIPLVADMSSDILSKPIEVSKFGLIYAGIQKNLGPAGVAVVVIRKDLLDRKFRPVPDIFSYKKHAAKKSILNTPPVFCIYAMGYVLDWMCSQGGLSAMAERNAKKAAMIYEAIDSSDFYTSKVERESRSLMNIIFTLPSDELTVRFLKEASRLDLQGLKGHREIGGIRASVYNAFPVEGAAALANFMKDFEERA